MNTAEVITREIETDHKAVMAELNRLLRIPRFSGSPQMSAFLQYVVTQTLQGNGGRIKAYTIGVEALGKPGSFDAQDDPSVRVLALRLRKALKGIYESEQPSSVIIEIKLGSYVPDFYQTKAQPIKGVQICDDRSSRLPTERFNDDSVADAAADAAMQSQSQRHSADHRNGNGSQLLANSVDKAPESATWKHRSSVKPVHMMSILLAVIFFMGVKLATDTGDAEQIQHAGSTQSEMPIQLLSMSKPMTASSGPTYVQSAMPSVYLAESDSHSAQLKQISTLISASLVDIGSLNVVRSAGFQISPNLENIDYLMMLNEASVESRQHVDAQIFRVEDGAVVMRDTLVFDKVVAAFSLAEMNLIEKLALAISDSAGPVSQDFCSNQRESVRSVICT